MAFFLAQYCSTMSTFNILCSKTLLMAIDCLGCSLDVVWQQINRQQITGCVHDACNPNLPWTLPAEERFPGNVMLLSVILRKMVAFHPLYLSHFPNLRTLNGYFTHVIRIVHSWTDVEQVCSGWPTEPLEDQVPDESLTLCLCGHACF